MREALIVVDVQPDFCEGGSLPVTGGHNVAERIAMLLEGVSPIDLVVFTKDWHEPYSDNGGHIALPPAEPDFVDSWPVHCIAGTSGAELHPALREYEGDRPVFTKGYGKPSYSGFEGIWSPDPATSVTLARWLRDKDVTHVSVCGLATDYCVRATALDAVREGFKVGILPDLTATIAKPIADVMAEIEEAQS